MRVCELAADLAAGRLTAEAVLQACLQVIDRDEPALRAWQHLDRAAALAAARDLDAAPVRGPLHGIPLAVKDLIDTGDQPTTYGSPIYSGHQPKADAAVVAAARAAGALILGKTVTTEFATFTPGATANPRRLTHTPGGSSSGSAAAVASGMVPVALGTQTAGSIIRPAAYCGVVGYKPSLGLLPRAGVKPLCDSLDTVGLLAPTVGDCAYVAAALTGRARLAEASRAAARPATVTLVRTAEWPHAETATAEALQRAADRLAACGITVIEAEPPAPFALLREAQQRIMNHELARALLGERQQHGALLSERLRAQLADADAVTAEQYDAALATAERGRAAYHAWALQHPLVLTPSAPGEAPAGLAGTGDPVFCRIWTLLGTPAVHLPFHQGPSGLPVGLQAIGRRGDDAALLAAARGLHELLTA